MIDFIELLKVTLNSTAVFFLGFFFFFLNILVTFCGLSHQYHGDQITCNKSGKIHTASLVFMVRILNL